MALTKDSLMVDSMRSSLASKVFDGEGKYIFISRRYAADELPTETDDLKIKSSQKGVYFGENIQGAEAFCGKDRSRTKEYDQFYVQKYHYTPMRVKHLDVLNDKKKEIGLDKLNEERHAIFRAPISYGKKFNEQMAKRRAGLEENGKKIAPLEKVFREFQENFAGSLLIKDEIRIPLTPEGLELHVIPTKKNLQIISREDIAEWYLLETSADNLANTPQKLETALKKRRTEILKNLPNDKQIDDLVDKDLIDKTKNVISERAAKKAIQDKKDRIAMGETTFREDLAYTLSQPQFYLLLLGVGLFFYLIYQLETWEPEKIDCSNPKSSIDRRACERAYERTYEEKWGRKPGKLPKIP